jgi:hypothetical protein
MNPGQHTFGVTLFFGPDGLGDAERAALAIYLMVIDNRICVEKVPRQLGHQPQCKTADKKAGLRTHRATLFSKNSIGQPEVPH